jgi:hypothetical protein
MLAICVTCRSSPRWRRWSGDATRTVRRSRCLIIGGASIYFPGRLAEWLRCCEFVVGLVALIPVGASSHSADETRAPPT